MKYTLTLYNDYNVEVEELTSTNLSDLLYQVLVQKAKWFDKFNSYTERRDEEYYSNLANTPKTNYRTQESAVNEFVTLWNNNFENQRNNIKTILINYDQTIIDKYWDYEYERETFPLIPPIPQGIIPIPEQPTWNTHLSKIDYESSLKLFDRIFTNRKKLIEKQKLIFQYKLNAWEKKKDEIEIINNDIQNKYKTEMDIYEKQKLLFEDEQDKRYLEYLKRKNKVDINDGNDIANYIEGLLSKVSYPVIFNTKYEIEYSGDTNSIVVNYLLPNVGDLFHIKEIKANFAQNKIVEKTLPKKEIDALYDTLIYSICLQSVRYIYASGIRDVLQSMVFNGWIENIDTSTGNEYRACIISLHTTRNAIDNINFSKVDPIECFRGLKGVSGAKLSNLSPVTPIIDIDKKDKRFVTSQDVLKEVDNSTNLASMGWEEFEHLIRQLFEKEFSTNGGEVKITQASRDGGVDAVAFDPDPIRGGKIVIQAKRYTNVVGVSAVRDLFGTVMNEGATKGILVTTSNYGSDAYEFAKGKPITLLNGGNLLSLLERHGYNARIDLKEAKRILNERENK